MPLAMSRLRVGLIGCGMISEFHLRGWTRIPEVEVAGLCDLSGAVAEARRAAFAPAAAVYTDPERLLREERLDVVDILTPPWLHAPHVRMACAAGAHVVCQKPLCPTLEEARALVAQTRGYRRAFAVHENHRHRAGAFGTARYLRLEQHDPGAPPERFKRDAENGVLLEYGTHLVDMVRALLGEPRRVYARTHRPNADVRGDSLAHAAFEYDGATAVVEISWKAGGLGQGGALFLGDRGEAVYEGRMTRGGEARFRVVQGADVVVDETRASTDDYVESFYRFERAFVDAVLTDRPFAQTAEENLRTLAATFAAYRAAAEGRVVDLEEI
jgi:predicted dehydrogenase